MWSMGLLLAGCQAQISGAPPIDAALVVDTTLADTPGLIDSAPIPIDGAIALGPWLTPQKIDVASTGRVEDDITLSSNTLELIFAINGQNGKDLFYASRATTSDAWTPAMPLPFNLPPQSEESPRLSADDRTLYFASTRAGRGNLDIFQTTRSAPGNTDWGPVMPADGMINTTNLNEKWFMPCGIDRYVMVKDGAGSDLVEGTIGGAAPVPIPSLNSSGNETGAFVTPDCLTIYFASTRVTPTRIFRAHRAALADAWPAPDPVNDFETIGGNQEDPWISSDERTFGFASDATGNKDLYLTTR